MPVSQAISAYNIGKPIRFSINKQGLLSPPILTIKSSAYFPPPLPYEAREARRPEARVACRDQKGVRGCHPRKIFKTLNAFWCILVIEKHRFIRSYPITFCMKCKQLNNFINNILLQLLYFHL